jgi:hypothetical protein
MNGNKILRIININIITIMYIDTRIGTAQHMDDNNVRKAAGAELQPASFLT